MTIFTKGGCGAVKLGFHLALSPHLFVTPAEAGVQERRRGAGFLDSGTASSEPVTLDSGFRRNDAFDLSPRLSPHLRPALDSPHLVH